MLFPKPSKSKYKTDQGSNHFSFEMGQFSNLAISLSCIYLMSSQLFLKCYLRIEHLYLLSLVMFPFDEMDFPELYIEIQASQIYIYNIKIKFWDRLKAGGEGVDKG